VRRENSNGKVSKEWEILNGKADIGKILNGKILGVASGCSIAGQKNATNLGEQS
jgi:hypothetical protein